MIRKFFLKHNKSFRRHLGDYEKKKSISGAVGGETLIFVCSDGGGGGAAGAADA